MKFLVRYMSIEFTKEACKGIGRDFGITRVFLPCEAATPSTSPIDSSITDEGIQIFGGTDREMISS